MKIVRQCVTLSDGDRKPRKVADAVDAVALLRECVRLNDDDRATIHVGLLQLPSGETVGLPYLMFDAPWEEATFVVSLRTAPRFRGRRQGASKKVEYEIKRLNNAEVDRAGTVTLSDQSILYSVEMSSAPMMAEPSELDWKIVHAALACIKGGERCYRSMREEVPFGDPELIPEDRYLDCQRLSGLELPPLKELVAAIRKHDRGLDKKSQQKIADALRKFGLRLPTSRRRVHRASVKAELG
jgi:hypothetical protein